MRSFPDRTVAARFDEFSPPHTQTEKEKAKLREERKAAKQMEATYWLELVDHKHRFVVLLVLRRRER